MTLATWDLTGIPWVEGGRDRQGADCLGIVLLGLEQLGVRLVDPWHQISARWSDGWRELHEVAPEGWVELPPTERPRVGDVLVSGKDGIASHVSIVADDGWHLTTSRGRGSHLERLRDLPRKLLWIWRRP